MSTTALIVAAGRGERLGATTPKQYLDLDGRSLLARVIDEFADHSDISAIAVVIDPSHVDLYDATVATVKPSARLLPPVSGAGSRQASVLAGLEALAEAGGTDRVLIHDAARPFIDGALIDRVLAALQSVAAVIPSLPVTDSLHRARADGALDQPVDRADLYRAQTPQGFHFAAILDAHRRFREVEATDDGALAHLAGLPVKLVAGDARNVKITTQADLDAAKRRARPRPAAVVRVGTGFDVHRFGDAPGPLRLGGITIDHPVRLRGHSDADVALHAITDALLGAIAAGDIGEHFPPSDSTWKDADSAQFLRHAADLIQGRDGIITHVDLTIICEAPKIGPYRDTMRRRIAEILDLDETSVSVKATTTERLGFTGRGEGIAAQATATVSL